MKSLSHQNLEKLLLSSGRPRYAKSLKILESIYVTSLRLHGFNLPQQRQFYKSFLDQNKNFLQSLTPRQRVKFWTSIWESSDSHEVLNLPIFYYSDSRHHEEALLVSRELLGWAGRLDNWAHSDGLSAIYARLLEAQGPSIDATLKKWNSHKNPWLRRQSLVSLYYYSAQRKKIFSVDEALKRIKNLMGDSHYYVQKGVGWAIREAYNVEPRKVLRFIETNIHMIPSGAYTAATEKLNARQKEKLRRQRKEHRKASRGSKIES